MARGGDGDPEKRGCGAAVTWLTMQNRVGKGRGKVQGCSDNGRCCRAAAHASLSRVSTVWGTCL